MCYYRCVVFFFFKQKTAYEMRISDWSSDVCSSDLRGKPQGARKLADATALDARMVRRRRRRLYGDAATEFRTRRDRSRDGNLVFPAPEQEARREDRKSVG